MESDPEPTTEELKRRVDKRAAEDDRRAEKAEYLREKLEQRERSEREAAAEDDDE
jgi:hypothetical protein